MHRQNEAVLACSVSGGLPGSAGWGFRAEGRLGGISAKTALAINPAPWSARAGGTGFKGEELERSGDPPISSPFLSAPEGPIGASIASCRGAGDQPAPTEHPIALLRRIPHRFNLHIYTYIWIFFAPKQGSSPRPSVRAAPERLQAPTSAALSILLSPNPSSGFARTLCKVKIYLPKLQQFPYFLTSGIYLAC